MISCILLIPARKNLAIQMNWRHWCAGRREGWRRGEGAGGQDSFQKLSLWEEETGAGRGGAQGWLFLNCNGSPLVPSPLSLSSPWTSCQRRKSPRRFILSAFPLHSNWQESAAKTTQRTLWAFPSTSVASFHKILFHQDQGSQIMWLREGFRGEGRKTQGSSECKLNFHTRGTNRLLKQREQPTSGGKGKSHSCGLYQRVGDSLGAQADIWPIPGLVKGLDEGSTTMIVLNRLPMNRKNQLRCWYKTDRESSTLCLWPTLLS